MSTERHRQLGFACDPAGAVIFAGDRVEVRCDVCGSVVDGSFQIARTFRTGSVMVLDRFSKQRHLFSVRFRLRTEESVSP